jgi:hypothetical protein
MHLVGAHQPPFNQGASFVTVAAAQGTKSEQTTGEGRNATPLPLPYGHFAIPVIQSPINFTASSSTTNVPICGIRILLSRTSDFMRT